MNCLVLLEQADLTGDGIAVALIVLVELIEVGPDLVLEALDDALGLAASRCIRALLLGVAGAQLFDNICDLLDVVILN